MGRRSKRGLEIEPDSEKVSPPSKMSKSINSAKADEILTKLVSIESRFVSLEKEVAEISKFLKEMDALKKEVETMREACSGFQRSEIESKKRSVLIRGIRFKSDEKFENRAQTKSALAELFNRIGVKPYLVDYMRLGQRRGDEDGSKVAIRAIFNDLDQKLLLFEQLKLKGKEFHDISILTDYPSFQLPEFKKLSEMGFKIRKETPGTRTRVVPRGLGLALQQRATAADRWATVSI